VDFSTPTTDLNNGTGYTLGWAFTLSKDVIVGELGYYDSRKDDLLEDHNVGIFDYSGTLLMSAVVVPGDTLDSWWRWNGTIKGSTYLKAGRYVIGGSTGLIDEYTWDPVGFVTAPEVTFVEDRYVADGGFGLTFPDVSAGGTTGWFGPNFKYEAVPEPATMAALGLGLAAVAARRRRKS
jgi:hypothetical protein